MVDSIAQKVARFRKEVTPGVKCFRPVRTFNRCSGMFEYHNCGHCPYCLSLRSNELVSRCFNECKQHKYSLFFTLTYDNEHIPYIEHIGHWYYLRNRLVKVDGLSTVIVHESEFDMDKSKVIESLSCPVDREVYGVVFNKDIQDFKKRLRITITRKLNSYAYSKDSTSDFQIRERLLDFRMFIAPEYGPTTLRPHYHGILWTDSEEVANLCIDPNKLGELSHEPNAWHGLIYKAWKMCAPERCDVQYVTKSAPNYVAQYVACTCSLPKVLQFKPFRPKPLASKDPIIGSYKVDFETVKDAFFNGTVEFSQWNDKEKSFVVLPLPYSLVLRFFPKCQAFSVQTSYDKLHLYQKYEQGRVTKRPVIPRGIFDKRKMDRVTLDYNTFHLDDIFNDYFRYQNKRFYKLVKFWSSRSFRFPIRDSLGNLVGYKDVRLTPLEVIRKFEHFLAQGR